MAEAEQNPEMAPESGAAEKSLRDRLAESFSVASPDVERADDEVENYVQTIVQEATKPGFKWEKNTLLTLRNAVQRIDQMLSQQLAKVMQHDEFRKLEGSWRGLQYLIQNSELGSDTNIYVRVLNVTHNELKKDFERATDFDQSTLFKKVYEKEFGQAGGAPYGALVYDHEFYNHPEEISLLKSLSGVAASAFAPLLSSASPKLFGLSSFQHLEKIVDLKDIFNSSEYAAWRSFRDSEDSRFVSLTMPKVLARQPYGSNTKMIEEFNFEEVALDHAGKTTVIDDEQYCWMSSAYAAATRLTDAFAKTGWCTAIRGHDSGGRVADLPVHSVVTSEGDVVMNCPTEVQITDRREKELSDSGFLPLIHWKDTDYAVFMGGQTVQKPKVYDKADATANAKICSRLPYVLATSRVSHYIKVLGRQWIGSFKEAADVQRELETWVMQYVSADDQASEEVRMKYPLREAKIQVKEDPSSPGAYNAIMWLRPWMQMEELNASVRMVARLPQPSN